MNTRRIALEALVDIAERGAYANLRLKEAQAGLDERDAAFVSALVYETLDHMLYADYMLQHFTKGAQKPVIRCILRMGVCQMLFMRVPLSAACNESVRLTKEIGKGAMAGYVNAVLRSIARSKDALPPLPENSAERLSILHSWPLWLVREWMERFGEAQTERILAAQPPRMTLRAQPPFTIDELREELRNRGIETTQGALASDCLQVNSGLDIAKEPLFQKGCVTVQGEGSMLVCRACGISPGMRVLDACAAPGGKSAYLSALVCGKLELHAWELHPHRVELLRKTLERLRVEATIREQDATLPLKEFDGYFDLVLLDAPCTGLGVAKPDVRYAKSPADVQALSGIQTKLFDACCAYVKPGGVLVYSTCTISYAENERQVEMFLQRNSAFALEELSPYLPARLHGLNAGMVQLLPGQDGAEGFFIARMRRQL